MNVIFGLFLAVLGAAAIVRRRIELSNEGGPPTVIDGPPAVVIGAILTAGGLALALMV